MIRVLSSYFVSFQHTLRSRSNVPQFIFLSSHLFLLASSGRIWYCDISRADQSCSRDAHDNRIDLEDIDQMLQEYS